MAFNNRFTSKLDGIQKAKRFHVCVDCRWSQPSLFKACPKCGSKNREYFPSKTEFHQAMHLLFIQSQGLISELEFHPKFPLVIKGVRLCNYIADARFLRDGKRICQDSKPTNFMDKTSELKMKLYEILYDDKIEIPQRKSGGI